MSDELEDSLVSRNEQQIEGKSIEDAKTTAQDLVDLKPQDAIAWFVKAKTMYVEGDYENALSCLSQAAQIDREAPQVWHLMGLTLLALGRLDEAVESLTYAAEKMPSNTDSALALGIALALAGKKEEAKARIEQAFKIDAQKASLLAADFAENFISSSPKVESATKALIERIIETRRVKAINGY